MNFLAAVNAVMREEGILGVDDDDLTTFQTTQHASTLELAKLAVKKELSHLVSSELIPYEDAEGTITTAASTRTYSLASGFIRFQDSNPVLLEVGAAGESENVSVPEYPGGVKALRRTVLDWKEQNNTPQFWYWQPGTTKTIGFFPVPDAVKYYRYYYESDVSVSDASDTLPFVTDLEADAFVSVAARRMKYLFASPDIKTRLFPNGLANDAAINESRGVLATLMRHKPPSGLYGNRYG